MMRGNQGFLYVRNRKVFFAVALTLCAAFGLLIVLPGRAHAINENPNPSNPRITGLWNTGRDTDGSLLDLPPRVNVSDGSLDYSNSNIPYPQLTTSTPEYRVPYNEREVRDPHWRLIGIRDPRDGSPHCQDGSPRRAVTMEPPYVNLNMGSDWVWWRGTMDEFSDPGKNTRWIGARPNSEHDHATSNGWTGPCPDDSTPSSGDSWPTWRYELIDGFNVGACVDPRTIRLNMEWGADDEFSMFVNGTRVLGPTLGGTVITQGSLNAGAFSPGHNDLVVEVRSSQPLTGFAINWQDPYFVCNFDEPYLRVYGNDVMAGGGFADSSGNCSVYNPSASIFTFDRLDDSDYTGSGSQLATFALGQIHQFFSAALRNGGSQPRPRTGLTFGNHTGSAFVGNYGGDSGISRCVPDYYGTRPATASGSIQLLPNNSVYGPRSIPDGEKRVVYVDGDVFIDDDIQFTNTTWPNKDEIPSFYLIARGNIYIDDDVEQLDGVYIAQPTGSTEGVIYTCATRGGASSNFGPVEVDKIEDTCDNQLTMTGAFIARQVKFMRSNGTVDDATVNELASSGEIAEVFNFSPELYLANQPSVFNSLVNAPINRDYDSIQSLPPIL